ATYTPTSAAVTPQHIGASYGGSDVHQTSSAAAFSLTVTTRHTTTTVSLNPATVVVNQPSSVTVTVTDDDPNGTKQTPTGTITLTNSGSEAFGGTPCTLAGTGASASCTVSLNPAAAGNHTIGATFVATSVHTTSTDSKTLVVTTRATTTAVAFNPSTVVVGQPSTVTVTVTDVEPAGGKQFPTGNVTVTKADATDGITGTCTLTSSSTAGVSTCTSTVTPTNVDTGSHSVTGTFTTTSVHTTSTASANLVVNN